MNTLSLLKGTITALVTPMKQSGDLDLDGLCQNIHFQISEGINGLLLLGSTGESPTINAEERRAIIQLAVQEAKGKVPVIVGCGTYATETTLVNVKIAEDLGADALLVVTPYYNCPTQEGLFQHFKAILEATTLPVMVYNIPKRCGRSVSVSTLKRLISYENFVGVKDSSNDISTIQETLTLLDDRPDLIMLSGDDILTLPMMSLGGHGVISVISNLVPAQVKKMVDHALDGNYSKALAMHNQLLPLMRDAFIETNPMPIKALMELNGMPAGPCRLPLCSVSEENKQKLQRLLDQQFLQLS